MVTNNKFDTRKLETYDHDVLILPLLTPQIAIVQITNKFTLNKNRLLKNHILLNFKLYVYSLRKKNMLNINTLLKNIGKVKKVEENSASNN